MKESYVEGLATHDGPESCAVTREGRGEALTGARAGRVLSRERIVLRTYGNTSHRNREIPSPPAVDGTAGRVGKSKDIRR